MFKTGVLFFKGYWTCSDAVAIFTPRHGARRRGRSGKYGGMPKWAFGWSVGWRVVAPGSLRRLAAAAGRRNGVEGRYTGSLRGQGVCGDCFDPFTHQERLLTARMVVLALLRRLGFWAPLEAHHASRRKLPGAWRHHAKPVWHQYANLAFS